MREQEVERELQPWVRWLARTGFVARGIVYGLIGFFALRSAIGYGQPSGSGGVFANIDSNALGSALLALLAAGLCCLVLWRAAQVVFGLMLEGKSLAVNLAIRFGWLCSGLFYAGLVTDVLYRLFAKGPSDHGHTLARLTGWTMHLPLGRLVIAGVGIGILVYAGWQLFRAASVRVVKRLQNRPRRQPWTPAVWLVIVVSEFGVLARGLVFIMVGGFLVAAAWQYRPNHSQGFSRALESLRDQPYGQWLLGAVALGLMAYAVFQFAMACWRRLGSD
ncbi:MAG: DUF1206 domain-containing protein [Rhodanobacteraceae bacterium]